MANAIEDTQNSMEQLKLDQEPNLGYGDCSTNPSSSSSSSSVYYSARSASMMENRSKFGSELEFNIEYSKVHWSQLAEAGHDVVDLVVDTDDEDEDDTDDDEDEDECSPEANLEHFERLKAHVGWGEFFRDFESLVVGEKIGEGAQAEIYAGTLAGKFQCVLKVFKEGYALRDLQRQWPEGMVESYNETLTSFRTSRVLNEVSLRDRSRFLGTVVSYTSFRIPGQSTSAYRRLSHEEMLKEDFTGPLEYIHGGTLLDNDEFNGRFAFVMKRKWGDLRKVIDLQMLMKKRGPPFSIQRTEFLMYTIAMGVNNLHKKYGIIHRDLKASNVLVDCSGGNTSYPRAAIVADFECSVGVLGTGFWRAPEILQQLKNGIPSSKIRFSYKSDVYSFGMTCYEIVTGRIPFEGHSFTEYYDQVVLHGLRLELPPNLEPFLARIISDCWKSDASQRPFFSDIVDRFIAEFTRRRTLGETLSVSH